MVRRHQHGRRRQGAPARGVEFLPPGTGRRRRLAAVASVIFRLCGRVPALGVPRRGAFSEIVAFYSVRPIARSDREIIALATATTPAHSFTCTF